MSGENADRDEPQGPPHEHRRRRPGRRAVASVLVGEDEEDAADEKRERYFGEKPGSPRPAQRAPRSRLVIVLASMSMSMRMLRTATFAAGLAVVVASPATAGGPPPTVPSDAAIAQYVEAVPSATGPVPVGGPATTAHAAALPPAVRGNIERTAGADAPVLLHIAQDPRYGARPVARPRPLRPAPNKTAQAGAKTVRAANPHTRAPRCGGLDGRFRRASARRPPAHRDHGSEHRRQGLAALAGQLGRFVGTAAAVSTLPRVRLRLAAFFVLALALAVVSNTAAAGPLRTGFVDPSAFGGPNADASVPAPGRPARQ